MTRFEQRRGKLRKAFRKRGADAMLLTDEVNVTYLTGFTGDDSYLLVTRDNAVMLSDSRYAEQLEDECPDVRLDIRRTPTTMLEALIKVIGAAKVKNLAFEADSLSFDRYSVYSSALADVEWAPTTGIGLGLREIKDKEEIAEIRNSIRIAERAFGVIKAEMRLEQTEKEVAHNLEHAIRRFGGSGCSFDPIVAVGPRAALPHANPTDRLLGDSDFVLIDWGATAGLYASDLTRVLVTARISPKLERIYGVVLKAQLRAIDAIRPGALMGDVDAAARGYIAKAGHGKHFGHGLGHGFGLQIHEQPRLSPNQDRPLKPGMVVTVEPGIYLPGWGGVRIEDDVLVTRSGHEVLTSVPKDLADCVVG